ncbi:hypothetical protein MVEN_01182500 [Mycena venus]|uniref:Uncharacterized protein n=1 Tax=Mycena venus TaxID=2733690 RepID=A0A8H6Y5H7_9AGAR|nr:hypothetical protein MVEN_01182500 [Mycena venus]
MSTAHRLSYSRSQPSCLLPFTPCNPFTSPTAPQYAHAGMLVVRILNLVRPPVAAVTHLDLRSRCDNATNNLAALIPRVPRAVSVAGVLRTVHQHTPHSVFEAHTPLACGTAAATAVVLSRDRFGVDASRVYNPRTCSVALFRFRTSFTIAFVLHAAYPILRSHGLAHPGTHFTLRSLRRSFSNAIHHPPETPFSLHLTSAPTLAGAQVLIPPPPAIRIPPTRRRTSHVDCAPEWEPLGRRRAVQWLHMASCRWNFTPRFRITSLFHIITDGFINACPGPIGSFRRPASVPSPRRPHFLTFEVETDIGPRPRGRIGRRSQRLGSGSGRSEKRGREREDNVLWMEWMDDGRREWRARPAHSIPAWSSPLPVASSLQASVDARAYPRA